MTNKTKMTGKDASRIQSAEAKSNGGKVSKDSFAARAAKAASKESKTPTTKKSSR